MKKLASLCLCLALLAALALPAAADVIWEPEDDFYFRNYEDCVRVESDYEAVGDAVIQVSPRDKTEAGAVPAGESLQIFVLWENWGYTESVYGTGWVRLAGFQRLYTVSDFLEEHGEEFVPAEGAVSRAENEIIYYWTYPGSGVSRGYIGADTFSWTDEDVSYQTLWTAGDGTRWAYMNYYYGATGWICLDAPGRADLPATAPRYAKNETAPSAARTLLVICLIVAIVVGTAALLIVLVLKRKQRTEQA